ncbi:hypothetical protein AXF42_Ash001844 [Apostasia shenzhenica]|uniref:Myb/SANT-like DNA-binding domain-containing protein n=1 Tax=Apostasia shenzhenica TaxID=1088818 RepID=A0A2I0ABD4_9ASPA|nr:hypothetical protein AXF42_Ash001844 [Apostasia shenzhenica]
MIFSSASALCNSMDSASHGHGPGESQALAPAVTKRDEWSEDGVLSLLEVYESKWLLRNRAKLKGADWEDIAGHVSRRSSASKAFKTPSQCKNKIESLKKRYRSEAAAGSSSWQFFARMDGLLKGDAAAGKGNGIKLPAPAEKAEEGDGDPDKASNTSPEVAGERKRVVKRRKGLGGEVADSISLLADSMLKMEQARMDTWKEWEKIRIEMEVKKKEMELRRTEIVAHTQLEIAKLLVQIWRGRNNGRS